METLGLTGSDLPEIGDKTAVSKVLNGDRPISHKMAYALAERFGMEPSAFLSVTSAKWAAHIDTVPLSTNKTSGHYVLHENALPAYSVEEAGAGEYKTVTSKGRTKAAKGPDKG
jgi:HTH-type transcriptional regulator/antitoxin HigA